MWVFIVEFVRNYKWFFKLFAEDASLTVVRDDEILLRANASSWDLDDDPAFSPVTALQHVLDYSPGLCVSTTGTAFFGVSSNRDL